MSFSSKIAALFGENNYSLETHQEHPLQSWLRIPRLHTLLPYESYDPKSKLFYNKGSSGFVLLGMPLVGASLKDQGQIADFFRQDQNLPEGCSMQFMLFGSPRIDPYLAYWKRHRMGPMFSKLAQRRAEFIGSKAYEDDINLLVRDFRVLISYTIPSHPKGSLEIEELTERRNSLVSALELMGMPIEVLDAEGLIQEVGNIINFHKTLIPEQKGWNKSESIANQIINSDMSYEVKADHVEINEGDYILKSYVPIVNEAPRGWAMGHMDRFIGDLLESNQGIPCPFFMHYGLYVEQNQASAKLKATTKREALEGALMNRMHKWQANLQDQYEESKEVVEEFQKKGRSVLTGLNMTIFCEKAQKSKVEQKLRHIWNSCGWQFTSARYDHLALLISSLPMMWTIGEKQEIAKLGLSKSIIGCGPALHSMGKAKETMTREAQNMLPLLAEWKGQQAPGMMFCGRRGQLFFWNPFSHAFLPNAKNAQTNHNYNICIAGQTGSGKSVFMNELMTTILGVGGHVFVLDMGRSFKKTCHILGGQHIEFGMTSSLCLNPFSHIPLGDSKQEEDDRTEMLGLLRSMFQVMAAPKTGTNDLQNAYLEQGIRDAWKRKKNKATVTDVQKYLKSRSEQAAHDLGQMLFSFTKTGMYGRFFEGTANASFDRSLVVIETDDLRNQPELMAVIVQMMILQINQMMSKGDRVTPFAIIIDEAWNLLAGKDGAHFINGAMRTARKYKGAIVLGTQHLTDYFQEDCPAATAAFKSSAWKCILYQESDVVSSLKEHPDLKGFVESEWQEELLRSVHARVPHYSEVAIYGPEIHGVIGRLRLDTFSRLLYSTNPEEYQAIENHIKRGLSVERAVESVMFEQQGRAA